jgi:hypothetical protein
MALFQQKKRAPREGGAHLNFMGGVSYSVDDPLFRLRLAASSCFFGEPMYYLRLSTTYQLRIADARRPCAA